MKTKLLNVKVKPFANWIGLGFLLMLVSGAASADYAQCPKGNFCAWDNYNGKGAFLYFHNGSDRTWHNDRPADGSRGRSSDRAQSAWNRSSKDVVIWENTGFWGHGLCAKAGKKYNSHGHLDNKVSSHQFRSRPCEEDEELYRPRPKRAAARGKTLDESVAPTTPEDPQEPTQMNDQ